MGWPFHAGHGLGHYGHDAHYAHEAAHLAPPDRHAVQLQRLLHVPAAGVGFSDPFGIDAPSLDARLNDAPHRGQLRGGYRDADGCALGAAAPCRTSAFPRGWRTPAGRPHASSTSQMRQRAAASRNQAPQALAPVAAVPLGWSSKAFKVGAQNAGRTGYRSSSSVGCTR